MAGLAADERIELASNPGTPSGLLAVLAEDDFVEVRQAVARNQSAPPAALAFLAEDALGPRLAAPPQVKSAFPEDLERSRLRSAVKILKMTVATHPNTPTSSLRSLDAQGLHLAKGGLQLHIAQNPSAPTELLEDITAKAIKAFDTTDQSDQILEWRYLRDLLGHVAHHRNASPNVLRSLAKRGWITQVAGNASTPQETLIGLAQRWGSRTAQNYDMDEFSICEALAKNPSLPAAAVTILASHPHTSIRKYCSEHHSDKLPPAERER